MSQNFNGYRGTPHASPPPHVNNDFTGLMGSLISPGPVPATPLQQAFNMPFYNATAWQNAGQGSYNFNVPFRGSPVNQDAWNQNGGDQYMALDHEEEENEDQNSLMAVDDTEILKDLQHKQQLNQNGEMLSHTQVKNHEPPVKPGQLSNPTLSSPLALPHPRLQGPSTPVPALVTKSPMVNDSAARAAELRAKLLAKRPSTTASPRSSPAVKKAELPNATQTSTQEPQENGALPRKQKTEDASKQAASQATAAAKAEDKPTNKIQERTQDKPIKDDEFELLFAQARNAADTAQPDIKMTNGSRVNRANVEKPADPPTNGVKLTKAAVSDIRPALQKNGGSSEMSEGEIHSGASSPTAARPSPRTIETKESKQDNQEKNEKLVRQNEVTMAYQPLKTPKQPIMAPAKISPQLPDHSKAEQFPSPKLSNKQLKQQAWKQRNGYAASHDLPPDSRRDRDWDRDRNPNGRDDDRNSRRPSTSQAFANPAQVERDARRRPSDDELRRLQRTEDNARRAAEYKKTLEAQRAAASKKAPDSSKTLSSPKEVRSQEGETRAPQATKRPNDRNDSYVTQLKIDTQMPTVESATGEQDIDTVMFSPTGHTVEEDEDISDWLELTEYYDLAHRERRLTWFRKKRALDVQRAELEREEQLELQERSMLKRSQSVLPTNTPSKVTRRTSVVHAKMPPPPLPLKEANSVGIKIKDAALSAGLSTSQTPATTLKRQHVEDDPDNRRAQPADKIARTNLNGHAANEKPLTSPASVREESAVRGDRYIPRQGRSRSPGFRRRSLSPRRQRYSRSPSPYGNRVLSSGNGIPRYLRTCHNCDQPGHIVNECPEPRRDGKEWNRPSDYQQWVSPNYRGRNPVAMARGGGNRSPHPRGGGPGNRSRYSSIGRTEDG